MPAYHGAELPFALANDPSFAQQAISLNAPPRPTPQTPMHDIVAGEHQRPPANSVVDHVQRNYSSDGLATSYAMGPSAELYDQRDIELEEHHQQVVEQHEQQVKQQQATVRSIVMASFVLAAVTTWNHVMEEIFDEYFPKQKVGKIGAYAIFAAALTTVAIAISRMD